jgi:hypothetical protein
MRMSRLGGGGAVAKRAEQTFADLSTPKDSLDDICAE